MIRAAIRLAGLLAASVLTTPAVATPPAPAPASAVAPPQLPGYHEPWHEDALPDAAVGETVRQRLPFTLEQIRRIHDLDRARRRAQAFARPVPTHDIRSITLGLDVSFPAPVIRAAQGYVTAIVFLDMTGAPWPVRRVLMRPEFRADGDADSASHIVYVAPIRAFDHGNVTVELDGLDLPVSLAVLVDDGAPADFRVAVRLPRAGPGAAADALQRHERFRAGDPLLGLFAAGTAPAGAVRVAVTGGDRRDRAWRHRGRLYLKTPKTLLAPGPLEFERGPDGDWIHVLADIPFAVLSDDGVRSRLGFSADLLPAVIFPAAEPAAPVGTAATAVMATQPPARSVTSRTSARQ